jgi:hypothetical protein
MCTHLLILSFSLFSFLSLLFLCSLVDGRRVPVILVPIHPPIGVFRNAFNGISNAPAGFTSAGFATGDDWGALTSFD